MDESPEKDFAELSSSDLAHAADANEISSAAAASIAKPLFEESPSKARVDQESRFAYLELAEEEENVDDDPLPPLPNTTVASVPNGNMKSIKDPEEDRSSKSNDEQLAPPQNPSSLVEYFKTAQSTSASNSDSYNGGLEQSSPTAHSADEYGFQDSEQPSSVSIELVNARDKSSGQTPLITVQPIALPMYENLRVPDNVTINDTKMYENLKPAAGLEMQGDA